MQAGSREIKAGSQTITGPRERLRLALRSPRLPAAGDLEIEPHNDAERPAAMLGAQRSNDNHRAKEKHRDATSKDPRAAIFAVLAFGTIAATAAQAEGPFYQLCKKVAAGEKSRYNEKCAKLVAEGGWELNRLINPATKEIEAEATVGFELAVTGITLKCSKLSLEKGSVLNGSTKGNAGTSLEVIIFTGCTVTGNGEKCEVTNGEIKTVPVRNTLDKENQTSVLGEKYLVSFAPKSGSIFVEVKFTGAKCKVPTTTIELGKEAKLGVAGIADNEAQHAVELKVESTETYGLSNLVEFPATLLEKEWVEEGGVAKEVKEKLSAFGKPVTKFVGKSKITLTGASKGETWGVFGVER